MKLFYRMGVDREKLYITPEELVKGVSVIDLLVATKLALSRSDAKRLIKQGGIAFSRKVPYLVRENLEKVESIDEKMTSENFVAASYREVMLVKGKKQTIPIRLGFPPKPDSKEIIEKAYWEENRKQIRRHIQEREKLEREQEEKRERMLMKHKEEKRRLRTKNSKLIDPIQLWLQRIREKPGLAKRLTEEGNEEEEGS